MLFKRNQLGLGKWLTQECLARGVKIMLNSEILWVELSTLNELQAVSLRINGQQETTLACKQMLLACGPWTPTVYERLFPAPPIRLQWTTDAGDWIFFKNSFLTIPESTAFVSFEPLIGESLNSLAGTTELSGHVDEEISKRHCHPQVNQMNQIKN